MCVRVCVRGLGVSLEPVGRQLGGLLRHEPMTLKCAPRLPNNKAEQLKSDTSCSLKHHLCWSLWCQAPRSARGQLGGRSWCRLNLSSSKISTPPHHYHYCRHPFLHSAKPVLHAWHWSVLQNHNRASRPTAQLTQTICRDRSSTAMGTDSQWSPPTATATTSPPTFPPHFKTDKQCFSFALQSGVLLWAFLVF